MAQSKSPETGAVMWTPGPWLVSSHCRDLILAGKEGGNAIAQALGPDLGSPEFSANARLIAAAPELFEALVQTRALVAACCDSGFTDEDAVMALFRNNGAITAALAKALGHD